MGNILVLFKGEVCEWQKTRENTGFCLTGLDIETVNKHQVGGRNCCLLKLEKFLLSLSRLIIEISISAKECNRISLGGKLKKCEYLASII